MISAHSFTLLKNIQVNDKTFSWPRKVALLPTPPVCVDIGGQIHRLSGFGSVSDEFLVTKSHDFYDALNLSVQINGNVISIPELAEIYRICLENDLDRDRITVFKDCGIKGGKSFQILEKIPELPSSLLKYIDEKAVPLKTIGLVISLDDTARCFISDFIAKTEPTLQSFKKFVETVCDFRNSITSKVYNENWEAPDVKTEEHKEIEKTFSIIQKILLPLKIYSADNFETGRLNISADINSYEDFVRIVANMIKYDNEVRDFLDLLEKYDIR